MSGVVIGGNLLDRIVIDRDGVRETIVPSNHVDNPAPSPFSIEIYYTAVETADALAASMAGAAQSMRASELVNDQPAPGPVVAADPPVELGLAPLSNGLGDGGAPTAALMDPSIVPPIV